MGPSWASPLGPWLDPTFWPRKPPSGQLSLLRWVPPLGRGNLPRGSLLRGIRGRAGPGCLCLWGGFLGQGERPNQGPGGVFPGQHHLLPRNSVGIGNRCLRNKRTSVQGTLLNQTPPPHPEFQCCRVFGGAEVLRNKRTLCARRGSRANRQH